MQGSNGDRNVAFLGSINVGGHRATKEQLCGAFERLGHRDVETFLASGNVIFDAGAGAGAGAEEIVEAAETALEGELGFAVPVYLRAAERVREIAGATPFEAAQIAASTGKPQVMLLREAPAADARDRALEHSSDEDRLAFGPRELHWLPCGGISDSELDLKALARLLGPGTVRTQNTIQRITTKFLD